MKALEACRAAGDQSWRGTGIRRHGCAVCRQGRYDAALKAQQEAVDIYQHRLNDRSYLTVCGAGRLRSTRSRRRPGRRRPQDMEEALKLAPTAKNDATTAETLNFLGDSYFYRRRLRLCAATVREGFTVGDEGQRAATGSSGRSSTSRNSMSRRARAQSAVAALKKLKQDTDTMGLKADSVRASIYLGEALLATNQADAAREELDNAVGRAEKLGLRVEQARAQYLLGSALARSGKKAEAIPHYRQAVNILESVSKEDGASRVLDRSDLKDVYREAAKGYQGAG